MDVLNSMNVCMYVYWVYIGGVWNLLLLIDQVRSLALEMAVALEWQRWLGESLLSAYVSLNQSALQKHSQCALPLAP